MAKTVLLRHEQAGIVKKGFYGFSWTVFFWGGFVPMFRGKILFGILMLALLIPVNIFTFGIAGLIWAFLYNKAYTTGLMENGYRFADAPEKVAAASAKLRVAQAEISQRMVGA